MLGGGLRRFGDRLQGNGHLWMIMVSTVLVMSGQGVVSPVLPLFARDLGASAAAVGLTLSSFAIARLALNVPLGIAADRWGRRLLLVAGPLVSALGQVGSALATGIPDLAAWRVLAGAGSAMYMTGAQIYLVDISTVSNRARVMGANQAALLFGVSVGPALGGLLADAFGLRFPFLVVSAGSLVAGLYAYLRLPETRPTPSSSPAAPPAPEATAGPPPWLALLRSRDFLAVSLVTASVFLTRAGGRFTLMPLLAADQFGYSPGALGALFTLMAIINLVGIAPAAAVSDRFGHKWAIVPSGMVVALALAGMTAAHSDAGFVGAALLLAVGTAIIGPAPAAYAAEIAPPALRGLTMGLFRSAGDLGFTLGPLLLGALADATSIGWALLVNGALVLASALWFGLRARERAAA